MPPKTNTSNTSSKTQNKFWKYKLLGSIVNKHLRTHKEKNNTSNKKDNEENNVYVKYGTWTDRIGVFINVVMVVATIFLFNQAVRQNAVAENNLILSDSVFQLSKRIFDSSLASQRDADKKNKEAFDMQRQLANSQIQYFDDNRKQFVNQHDVELRVDNQQTEPGLLFTVGKPIVKKLTLNNLGIDKVTVEGISIGVSILEKSPSNKEIFDIPTKDVSGITVSPQNPFDLVVTSIFKLTTADSLAVDYYKTKSVYIFGKVIFMNNVIKTRKTYTFVVKTGNYPWITYENPS